MASFVPELRLIAAVAVGLAVTTGAHGQSEISPAEQRLFLDEHLANLPATAELHYVFTKTGTLEPAFEDQVRVHVQRTAAGTRTHVEYLSGEHTFVLPDVESATGNPVILSFLERDVREMERRTGGRASYFRKRVRLALAEHASVNAVGIDLGGRTVDGIRISIRPYENDPMRARFPALIGKTYAFTLAAQVPGGVYEMRTEVPDRRASPDTPPLLLERLIYIGVEP